MINPNEYIVAIPSYKRESIIVDKTLKMLNDKGVSPSRIFIFVADKDEENNYLKNVPKKLYNKIIVGELGLRNQRNYISKYFPENTCIVQCDDDLNQVNYLQTGSGNNRAEIQKNNKLVSMKNIDMFFKDAFHRLMTNNTTSKIDPPNSWGKYKNNQKPYSYLWGIYPVNNPYFLSNKITNNLQFIGGGMFGIINRHHKDLKLDLNEKEDFERTLRNYKMDGSVFRFWNISHETLTRKGKGGMQAENKDRNFEAQKSAEYLIQHFPQYISKLWYKGKEKHPEIKLKANSQI